MEPRLCLTNGILSSITSVELQKIIVLARYIRNSRIFALRFEAWDFLDEQLCELVARLGWAGYRHILEVEVRFAEVGGDPRKYEFAEFLPKFREKGIVTIIDTVRDLVLHSSTVKAEPH